MVGVGIETLSLHPVNNKADKNNKANNILSFNIDTLFFNFDFIKNLKMILTYI